MVAATILVVDDEPQIRRVLRSTLTSQGYVIIDAKTGGSVGIRAEEQT